MLFEDSPEERRRLSLDSVDSDGKINDHIYQTKLSETDATEIILCNF